MIKEQKKAIIILFISLFLVMAGFGLVIPIVPFYIEELGGGSITYGLFLALFSLMQLIFTPFWGRLSDRIGRRPVLMIGIITFGITFILFGLAKSLKMLFAARILAGIFSSAVLPTAMAYIADITTGEARSKNIGLMGAAMGVGMVFGPVLGGWLGHFSFSLPFFVAGGFALLTFPFAFIFLPESLKERKAVTAKPQGKDLVKIIHHPLLLLFVVAFLTHFSMALFQGTFPLFAADKAGFNSATMGTIFAVMGLVSVIVQGFFIGKLVARFGDANLVKYGVVISATGMLLVTLSSNSLTMAVSVAVFSIGNALMGPCSSSLVTKNATGGQGLSLGIMQSFGSLGRILGPVIGGWFYKSYMYGPYLLGAAIMFTMIMATSRKLVRYDQPSQAVQ